MALLDIPLDRITEADVRRLIAAGAAESLYVDYKQATYGGKEADHAELLADVSSFAKAAGGGFRFRRGADPGRPPRPLAASVHPDHHAARAHGQCSASPQ